MSWILELFDCENRPAFNRSQFRQAVSEVLLIPRRACLPRRDQHVTLPSCDLRRCSDADSSPKHRQHESTCKHQHIQRPHTAPRDLYSAQDGGQDGHRWGGAGKAG